MAATGARYVAMAKIAAGGLRRHSPGVPIHLYSDDPEIEGPFDRVIGLKSPWRRSKIDAMIDAPFSRCLYLDADTFVTADISDVFRLLDRFDLALAHDQERNGHHAATLWRRALPPCFPQFNSGVVAYRRTPEVLALLSAWREAVLTGEQSRDQPSLRELLWESDLRIATLPPEYNLMDLSSLLMMNAVTLAPRVIHHYRIHADKAHPPAALEIMLGHSASAAIRAMVANDRYLTPERSGRDRGWRRGPPKRLLQLWMLLEIAMRRLRRRIARSIKVGLGAR